MAKEVAEKQEARFQQKSQEQANFCN